MYCVKTDAQDKNTRILYKIRKDGTKIEQARSTKTLDGKLLMLDKYKKKSFEFKGKDDIKWLLVGTQYIGNIANEVQLYIRPHYQEFHRVLMSENYNRFSLANAKYKQSLPVDNIELDDKGILDNMLEYVGTL